MSVLNRRSFIAASLAMATVGAGRAMAQTSTPDVVVIGAGAAGMAAARALLSRNLTVTVVEAADRIGGRVHTDHAIFGEPYDIGAHWLHASGNNPFVDYGRENGFDVYRASDEEVLYVGNRVATDDEADAFYDGLEATYRAIARAGESGRDVSPADVVPDIGEWSPLAHLYIGPWSMAKNFENFSCVDWYSGEDGSDSFCRQGYGALWAHSVRGIPVERSTAVTAVDWSGDGVRVETNKGTIVAKACIVTVSTGVLAAERIRFSPELPVSKRESFHGISMGLYNHIAFQFRRNIFGTPDDGYLVYKVPETEDGSPRGFAMVTNIAGGGLSLGDVGGNLAWTLEKAGTDEARAFGLEELRRMFGSDVDKELVKVHVTEWGKNPLTLGSYASAEPGRFPMRNVLRQSVGDRIFFAGEACSRSSWAMVHGAHRTGIEAASEVAETLDA